MTAMLVGCGEQSGLSDYKVFPPRPITDMVLVKADGEALPVNFLKGKWNFIILADSNCDDTCKHYLKLSNDFKQQQVKEIQRLLVTGYEPDKDFLKELEETYPDLVVTVLTRPIWAIFTVQLRSVADEIAGEPLFLISPDGLLMMAYDDFAELSVLNKDFAELNRTVQ